ncbi:MAG: serine/threonine-protein kinase [Gemmatimonadota bacterium]
MFCPADGTTLRTVGNDSDLVGSVIADRYMVQRLLGEGGMGRVYLARHVRLPQQAAIKVLHHAMVEDADAIARFNREAANAARIEHDRVARVFDFGETSEGLVYLAMEYVPGRTLRALIEEEGRLPPVRAANIVMQVAEGLDAAHRLGIVHRDLKPDNILIVPDDGGVDRCKVVDFGIAKASGATTTQITRTGMIVGTPEFMSPEQVVGEAVDARSDVYALGLVAYQMFAGVLPFTAATPERALAARLVDTPRRLADSSPETSWPAELQAAIDGALAREPSERTASALAFAESVVESVEAWVGAPVRRGRTPIINTPVGVAGVGGTQASGAAAGAQTPTLSSPDKGESASRSRVAAAAVVILSIALVAVVMFSDRGETSAPDSGAVSGAAGIADGSSEGAPTSPRVAGGGLPQTRTAPPPSQAAEGPPPATDRSITAGADSAAPSPTVADASVAIANARQARAQLDSIQAVLEGDDSGEGEARAAIPRLRQLIGSLATATDSTWAWLTLVNAHQQAREVQRACAPLREARKQATTGNHLAMIREYSRLLPCAPTP